MPQLDISTFPSQLFWLGVCFLTLYFILSYIAVPKIAYVLATREEGIEEKINTASTYREEAEDLLADYEAILAKARETAHLQYKAMTSTTTTEIAYKQRAFLDKLNDRLHLAEQELYRARLEASEQIKPFAVELASTILKKLLGHTYSSKELLAKTKGG